MRHRVRHGDLLHHLQGQDDGAIQGFGFLEIPEPRIRKLPSTVECGDSDGRKLNVTMRVRARAAAGTSARSLIALDILPGSSLAHGA